MSLIQRVANLFPSRTIYKTPADEAEQQPYLTRYYVFPFWGRKNDKSNDDDTRTFPYAIYLHRIFQSDTDRHLHDHPWSFISIILEGGYTEEVPHPIHGITATFQRNVRNRWSAKLRRATDLHRVRLHGNEEPIWSLMLVGPREREWGYETEEGWIHWKDYWANDTSE